MDLTLFSEQQQRISLRGYLYMDSLAFLARVRIAVAPLYVVAGDETFLKRQVLCKIRSLIFGEESEEFGVSVYSGETSEYAEVMDELHTLPFFGSRRLVIVENADPFVTKFRSALQKAIASLPKSGTFVLEVRSWSAATNLAKAVDKDRTIFCKSPTSAKTTTWCIDWAQARHGKQLTRPAAQLLVDLIGTELGQLDQELEKLAVFVGQRQRINDQDVDQLVGRSQAQSTWQIFDAIGQADTKRALAILDSLLQKGEEPLRIVGALAMQMRRLAQAGRLAAAGTPLRAALTAVGFPPFAVSGGIQQIQHLGRERVESLYERLLRLNLDLRGNSALPPRILLERLVIQLGKPK